MPKQKNEGTIIRQFLGHYYVSQESRVVDCALSSRLRKKLEYPEASAGSRRRRVQSVHRIRAIDPVAIGDQVIFNEGDGETGMIKEVLPRRNKISRRASGTSGKEQILAANVDQALPIFSVAKPTPDFYLLDRMLAIAEWQEIPSIICMNKIDLKAKPTVKEAMDRYARIGYRSVFTSVVSNLGKKSLQNLLKGRVSLFLGPSGTGKSSLLNWLQPKVNLRIGEISQISGEGKHTTTHTELIELECGGLVGDIPGVREFHLWNIKPEDTPLLFREFRRFLGKCRFRDCIHVHEPDCAIQEAVKLGEIDPFRYSSYLRLHKNP